MALYVPGTEETDPRKIIMSQQLVAGQTTTNTTNIATNTADIANRVVGPASSTANGFVVYNGTTGKLVKDHAATIALASEVSGNLPVANLNSGTSAGATTFWRGDGTWTVPVLSSITNSLGSDVALNNTANYFDGPSVAQGSTGTWFVSGKVTVTDTGGAVETWVKLWDGTTVIDSGATTTVNGSTAQSITLSGYITSPAGNIKISCRNSARTTGKILFNQSGNSKDSTITAIRIA